MADERSDLRGDGSRAAGRWLDRDTAERLLRGEPLDHLTPPARDQAEQLADALGALAAAAEPNDAPVPGEDAALAAFRAARSQYADHRADQRAGAGRPAREEQPADAGLVRIGSALAGRDRARRFRPARLGLAAALTAGMLGGVAVAAGTGALPSPFDGPAAPGPAASVSADATPGRPLTSPSPDGTAGPDGRSHATTGPGGTRDTAGGATTEPRDPAASGRPGPGWPGTTRACRDLDSGHPLDDARRHALEGAAGGSARVWTYCKGVLARETGTGHEQGGTGTTGTTGSGHGKGQGKGGDQGKTGGTGKGGDDEDRDGPGDGTTNGGGNERGRGEENGGGTPGGGTSGGGADENAGGNGNGGGNANGGGNSNGGGNGNGGGSADSGGGQGGGHSGGDTGRHSGARSGDRAPSSP
ncbi:hypothetical protein [Streptomyces griseosporeus]|uniref:hypothetical protein n=1 Tax=Streptomyces griseosporeus TaxID=1910 RepID=UPI0036FEBB0E